MSETVIREAGPADAVRLLEIYSYYVKNTAITFEYEPPTLEEFRGRITRVLERYPYLAAERDGAVLGYAYAGPFNERAAYAWSCELSVYLDREARKQGLGRALYGALEERLRQMGILNLYACIAWPEAEDPYLTRDSAEFHRRMGFEKAGEFRRCGCKFGRWYGVLWMEKLLGEHAPGQPAVKFPWRENGLR